MKLPRITTQKEFDSLIEQLDEQGFILYQPKRGHELKLDRIIRDANAMDLRVRTDEIIKQLWPLCNGDYDKLGELAKEHFGRFTTHDKIEDLFGKVYPLREKNIEIKEAHDELLRNPPPMFCGYELSPVPTNHNHWSFYDLRGKYLKLYVRDSHPALLTLVKLTLAPEFNLQATTIGNWHDEQGVKYKLFKNGTILLDHPKINELKVLYKAYLLKRTRVAVAL